MAQEILTEEEKLLFQGTLRLNPRMIGLIVGLVLGGGIFVATIFLLIKGEFTGASERHVVGSHLALLREFFIGYRVSFFGSIIGFFYGLAIGTLGGAAIGWIYNKILELRNGR
jgi:hypothetical protein